MKEKKNVLSQNAWEASLAYLCVTQSLACIILSVAPPSYAKCVRGGASITNEGDSGKALGDSSFTPTHPFANNYQFPSAPPTAFPQDPAFK